MTLLKINPAQASTVLCSALLALYGFSFDTNGAEALSQSKLTLQRAIAIAVENDPWLTRSDLQQKAMEQKSEALPALPNPVVSIGLANLPTDGFAFDQEPMTQLKASVSQMLPRGESLSIQRKHFQTLAQQHPLLRQDRIASTIMKVSELWFDVYRAQQIVALIEQDRALFEQLSEITQISYSSAVGRVRQQDIVRGQLELTRLEDRLLSLMLQKEQAGGRLLEWLGSQKSIENLSEFNSLEFPQFYADRVELVSSQPELANIPEFVVKLLNDNDRQGLARVLSAHPALLAIEQSVKASKSNIELAKQQYKPQWGVNASYAYRADDTLGRSRADFLSIGLSFDLPLFAQQEQDSSVAAAVSETEAMKTDRLLALRKLLSQLQTTWSVYQRLLQRQTLYDDLILVQSKEQAEASTTAYTNDDGDFAEVVRARIDNLNARIDSLNIAVDIQKSKVKLNYLLTSTSMPTVSAVTSKHSLIAGEHNE